MATIICHAYNGLYNRVRAYASCRRIATMNGHKLKLYESTRMLQANYALELDGVVESLPRARVFDRATLQGREWRVPGAGTCIIRSCSWISQCAVLPDRGVFFPWLPKLRPHLQDAVDREAERIGIRDMVGLHVRWSDHVKCRKRTNLPELERLVRFIRSTGKRVYLATDTEQVEASLVAAGAEPTGNGYKHGITWGGSVKPTRAMRNQSVMATHLLAMAPVRFLSGLSSLSQVASGYAYTSMYPGRTVWNDGKTMEQLVEDAGWTI